MPTDDPRPDSLSRPWPVTRVRPDRSRSRQRDALAVEAPLEIRIGEDVLAVVMRTPGHDLELTGGLLLAEGVIDAPADVAALRHCDDVPDEARGNVVVAALRPGLAFDREQFRRNLIATSACGICGRESIERLAERVPRITSSLRVPVAVIAGLPGTLRRHQAGFERTGGLHAAALFDEQGQVLVIREDVGRHNAVDKVIGSALRHDLLPLDRVLLAVSGRASFEILQKARVAGIPIVVAVSAPSSLAVELAVSGGQTLAAFVRDGGFNLYSGNQRVEE